MTLGHPERLSRLLDADEAVTLTRMVGGSDRLPGINAPEEDRQKVLEPQPVGLLVFFSQPGTYRTVSWHWRRAH